MSIEPRLLTVRQFQDEYSVSHGQFYREVAAGRLRVRKMGRATRIARDDAEAWAESLPTAGGAMASR